MKRSFIFPFIALMVLIGTIAALGQVQPGRTINCSGVLRDTTSAPVRDGYHTISISLYQSQYGGVPVCSSVRRVEVKDGRFQAQVKVPPTFLYNETYYVSVAEVGNEELAVRTELGRASGGSSFTEGEGAAPVQGEGHLREIAVTTAAAK